MLLIANLSCLCDMISFSETRVTLENEKPLSHYGLLNGKRDILSFIN